jgi:methyltransferase (TIGR00027 family)
MPSLFVQIPFIFLTSLASAPYAPAPFSGAGFGISGSSSTGSRSFSSRSSSGSIIGSGGSYPSGLVRRGVAMRRIDSINTMITSSVVPSRTIEPYDDSSFENFKLDPEVEQFSAAESRRVQSQIASFPVHSALRVRVAERLLTDPSGLPGLFRSQLPFTQADVLRLALRVQRGGDPLAELMLSKADMNRVLYQAAKGLRAMVFGKWEGSDEDLPQTVLRLHQRYMEKDRELSAELRKLLLRHDFTQVVVLGVGADTRSFTMGSMLPSKVSVFEVDTFDVISYRERMFSPLLADLKWFRGRRRVPVRLDLEAGSEKLFKVLVEHGFDPKVKTLFFSDSLVNHINVPALGALVYQLSVHAAEGSCLVTDRVTVVRSEDSSWAHVVGVHGDTIHNWPFYLLQNEEFEEED